MEEFKTSTKENINFIFSASRNIQRDTTYGMLAYFSWSRDNAIEYASAIGCMLLAPNIIYSLADKVCSHSIYNNSYINAMMKLR